MTTLKIKSVIKLPFARPKEKFLILEVLPAKINALFLGLDNERNLSAERFISFPDWSEKNFPKEAKIRKKSSFLETAVISLDRSFSFTVLIPLDLERENPKQPLEKTELENIITQAIGKIFNQYRGVAGRYLKIDELDAVLIKSSFMEFRLDGHEAVNPLGFRAKAVHAVLGLTFASRNLLNNFKSIFGSTNLFFTEIGTAELSILQKINKPPINFLFFDSAAVLFVLDDAGGRQAVKKYEFGWRPDCFSGIIVKEWGVGSSIARQLYQKFLNRELSSKITGYFQKIFQPPILSLFQKIGKKGIRGRLYLNSPVDFPFLLPFRQKGILLEELPLDKILEILGFKINFSEWDMSKGDIFRKLAPFWEFYYNKKEDEINRWLRRRLHWLGAAI